MYGSIRRREVPVAWVGRVAGVSPQLQGLPAVRVQVFAMPATAQQEHLSLCRLHETCGQGSCDRHLGQLCYDESSCTMWLLKLCCKGLVAPGL